MISKFENMLMRTLIERRDFMPLRDEEGNFNIYDGINILTKNSFGSNVIVDLINGDKFTSEQITARLQENRRIISELKARDSCYFFEVFIFENEPDKDKLNAIIDGQFHKVMGKKYLKCISINLSRGLVKKHFKIPISDMNLAKTIKKLIASGITEETEIIDIKSLVLQKEKEYEMKLKVKVPVLTYALIAINIIIAVLISLYSTKSGISYSQLLIDFGAKENSRILAGEYWRFITPIFLHANITHLLINCYSLYIVGITVERIFGRFRFLTVYIIAGILGNVGSFMFSVNPGVGASGAIFGLLGTLLYFGLEKPALFKVTFGYNVLITIFINLVYGFSTTGIDNFAHLGGLIGGFLVSGIISESEKPRWYLNRYLYLVLTIVITFSGLFYGFNNNQSKIILGVNELEKLDKDMAWSKAEAKAEQILELEPSGTNMKVSVLWTLVKAEALSGKYNEAVEHAKMLKQIDPPDGHYMLGLLYFDMKEFNLSKEELLEAKKAGATYEQIDKLLGEIK